MKHGFHIIKYLHNTLKAAERIKKE